VLRRSEFSGRFPCRVNGREQQAEQDGDDGDDDQAGWAIGFEAAGAGEDGSIAELDEIAPGEMELADGVGADAPRGDADELIAIGGREDDDALAEKRAFLLAGDELNFAKGVEVAELGGGSFEGKGCGSVGVGVDGSLPVVEFDGRIPVRGNGEAAGECDEQDEGDQTTRENETFHEMPP
jgi:hypothetical protein